MIRIHLDELTLGRVRIAISPLWEAVSSLSLIIGSHSETPYPYVEWVRKTVPRISPLLRQELTALTRNEWSETSSSLTPIPKSSTPGFEEELLALRSVGHDKFAELIGDYWDAALAPYWSDMRNVLEEEILVRGRKLVTAGADRMLQDLGGQIRWDRPELSVPHQADLNWKMADGRLIIVSVLFARGTRFFATQDDAVAFSYQAQGSAVLSRHAINAGNTTNEVHRRDKLTNLLGRGRASVLKALLSPTTTTGLASCIGLAPSTVSQHLSVLSAAGLVRRLRVGPRVLYELEESGAALLAELGT
ncbi:hypothetical protein SSPO_000570 [Streptomyces antimycoticus]|uniref:HTH arsR-type domain-containing protein n=1 Tax=Streptomyces antimycoticus TaxID=68175 RepID=A0A499UJV7_9ACTN|nr:winged helix-turn-helix domain-containing protein [Streptomyces antimycoticus]BBJ37339.1 hypothetical protein SSPO_000570 [Streptomyces antimycoticus]